MRALAYMAFRDKIDVDAFHPGIQYALEKLEKTNIGFKRIAVSNFKSKDTWALGTRLFSDYSRTPCLGADQKANGLWERDIRVIDQVRGQDGWILAEFFFYVFMDRDEVEVHKLAKKERGQ